MRAWLLALCIIGWMSNAEFAQARSAAECDPRIDDFWHNITCTKAWDDRIRQRLEYLRELQDEYQDLLEHNASLEQRVDRLRRIVGTLQREIDENRRALNRLSQTQVTQANIRQTLKELQEQAALIVAAFDVVTRTRLGCDSGAYERAKEELAKLSETYSDISTWSSIGSLTADLIAELATKRIRFWLNILSGALQVLGIISEARADDLASSSPDPRLIRCD